MFINTNEAQTQHYNTIKAWWFMMLVSFPELEKEKKQLRNFLHPNEH